MKDANFQFFSNCIPVKGFLWTSICDLQLKQNSVVPNVFIEAILNKRNNNIAEEEIKELELHFVEQGLGRFTDNHFNFPP